MNGRGKTGALGAAFVVMLVTAACGPGGGDGEAAKSEAPASETAGTQVAGGRVILPEQAAELDVSAVTVAAEAGKGQTLARDAGNGAVYMSSAREVPGQPAPADGEDPAMEIVVAASSDDGRTFGEPVVVSDPDQSVNSSTASPAQVTVGPGGEVYVVYSDTVESELSDWGADHPYIVRSDDGARTFSDPVAVVTDEREAPPGGSSTYYMNGLFVASDGDLFYSFLDGREEFHAKAEGRPTEAHGHGDEGPFPEDQLRVARSGDKGVTWSRSVMVAKPTCACCSTSMAEDADGNLFATTRSAWAELKGSQDEVRDQILSRSTDDGATWSKPVKVHDDGFKISGCPDVAAGLAADSTGMLHVAWYTGTEAHPGVYYATSKDGVTFSKPVALLKEEWVPYADVRLVIDGEDRPWVAFEDRTGEVDQVRLVRVDSAGRVPVVSTSASFPGHGPGLVAGEDWAVLTWEAKPVGGHGEAPGPVHGIVARPST